MPNALLELDTAFPRLDGKSDRERIGEIGGYLYHMRELLTYLFHNLGRDNFNDTSFKEIAQEINAPISAMIADAEGKIAALTLTAEGLTSRVSDAEGNISTLTQTSESLSSRVSNNEGNISTLTQTSESLSSRVSDAEGNVTSLRQTADGLRADVDSVGGVAAQAYMTANSISISVTDGVTGPSIVLRKDGKTHSIGEINMTGYVTFNALAGEGTTVINGANIQTGTVSADVIRANANGFVEFTAPIAASYGMFPHGMYLGDESSFIAVMDSQMNGQKGLTVASPGGVQFYNGAYVVIGGTAYPYVTTYDLRQYGLIP